MTKYAHTSTAGGRRRSASRWMSSSTRDRAPPGHRSQGGAQPSPRQHRRVNSSRQFAKLLEGHAELALRGFDDPRYRSRVVPSGRPRLFEAQADGDELLLGAVMDVAFDLLPSRIGGRGDALTWTSGVFGVGALDRLAPG